MRRLKAILISAFHVQICIAIMTKNEPVHQSFEELGDLAVGVVYGHVHTFVNTTETEALVKAQWKTVKSLCDKAKKTLNETKASTELTTKFDNWTKTRLSELNAIVSKVGEVSSNLEEAKVREERQAAIGLAALGITAFGFSLYSEHRLEKLQDSMTQDTETLASFIEISQTEFNRTQENLDLFSAQLEQVKNKVKHTIDEVELLKFQVMVDHHVSEMKRSVETWKNGVYSMLGGKTNPDLIPMQTMKEELDKLEEMAREKGLKPLHQSEPDFYQFSISTKREEDGVRVYIHVPMTRGDILKVYRHLPTPFFDEDEKVIFVVQPESEVLAINKDTGRSITMELAELNRCRRVNRLYYCDHQRVLDRTQQDSCVGAMFAGLSRRVKEICPFYAQVTGDAVTSISHTKFRLFSTAGDVRVYQDCEKDYVTVKNGEDLDLKPGCSGQTPGHWFTATSDLDSDKTVILTPILTNISMVPLGVISGKVRETLIDMGVRNGTTLVNLEKLRQRVLRKRLTVQTHYPWTITTLVLVIVTILTMIVVKMYQRRPLPWPLGMKSGHEPKVRTSQRMSEIPEDLLDEEVASFSDARLELHQDEPAEPLADHSQVTYGPGYRPRLHER